jgi:hypothetical protein
MPGPDRTSSVMVRVTPEEARLLERAAQLAVPPVPRATWARDVLVRAATAAIEDARPIRRSVWSVECRICGTIVDVTADEGAGPVTVERLGRRELEEQPGQAHGRVCLHKGPVTPGFVGFAKARP